MQPNDDAMTRQIALLLVFVGALCPACKKEGQFIFNEGFDHATTYHMTYESPNGKDLHEGIAAVLKKANRSLSTFDPHSTISKVNQNKDTVLDDYFLTVYRKAMEIAEITGGAFDITVAPLVNAWGFGFKNKEQITPALIDSLKQLVGYQKVRLENGKIIKQHPNTMLDCNALAEGYMCDLVAGYLAEQGCKNYMVEIGGEVVVRGKNTKGKPWRIGVSKPDDGSLGNQELEAIVGLTDKALATSGNYRNFYLEDGKKYAHTIDPKTGCPVQHNLLSATVLADHCMTADAFATAFMVLGLGRAIELADSIREIEVYFIYADEAGQYKSYASEGFVPLLIRENN